MKEQLFALIDAQAFDQVFALIRQKKHIFKDYQSFENRFMYDFEGYRDTQKLEFGRSLKTYIDKYLPESSNSTNTYGNGNINIQGVNNSDINIGTQVGKTVNIAHIETANFGDNGDDYRNGGREFAKQQSAMTSDYDYIRKGFESVESYISSVLAIDDSVITAKARASQCKQYYEKIKAGLTAIESFVKLHCLQTIAFPRYVFIGDYFTQSEAEGDCQRFGEYVQKLLKEVQDVHTQVRGFFEHKAKTAMKDDSIEMVRTFCALLRQGSPDAAEEAIEHLDMIVQNKKAIKQALVLPARQEYFELFMTETSRILEVYKDVFFGKNAFILNDIMNSNAYKEFLGVLDTLL